MANRYSNSVQGTNYLRKPFETLLKVGMLKDQSYGEDIANIQANIDASANYNTVFNPDTEYKIQKANQLLIGINEIAKSKADDPLVQNKIRSQINQFSNDPEVLSAIQRTNSFGEYKKNVEKLGKDYRDQNALEYLDNIKKFQLGDKQAGEALKLAPSIDPYKDWEGEFITGLDKLKTDKTITGFGSNYLTTSEGVTPQRVNQLLLNGLSSESYQQMQKDYQYEKYTGMTDKDWDNWVTDKAITKGQIYSYVQNDAKYTGDANARLRLKLAASTLESNETGIPAPVGSTALPQDLKSAIYKNYGLNSTETREELIQTPVGLMKAQVPTNNKEINRQKMISDFAEKGGKAILNKMQSAVNSGIKREDISAEITSMLQNNGLSIKRENGKVRLIGSDKDIENFMMKAITNQNSNALGGYTIPNWDPKESAEQLLSIAGTQGVTISVDGSSPTESKAAFGELLAELNSGNARLASVSPNSQFQGRPTLKIFVPAKTTSDGTIPGKTYDVGLDNYSQAIFSDNTNIYNSLLNADLDKEIPLNNKAQFKVQGKDNIYQYSHGVNSIEIDQNGEPYINTNIVFYDINDTEKKTPYYEDYNKYTQEEVLPDFMNAPWNTPYKKKFNKAGYQEVMSIMDEE